MLRPDALEIGPPLDGLLFLAAPDQSAEVHTHHANTEPRRSWRGLRAGRVVDGRHGQRRVEPCLAVGEDHSAGRRRAAAVTEDERPEIHEPIVDEAAISS